MPQMQGVCLCVVRLITGFLGQPVVFGRSGAGSCEQVACNGCIDTDVHGSALHVFGEAFSSSGKSQGCARQDEPEDSHRCQQFFIVQGDARSLDGSYAAFGSVTSGMEVVDAICEQVSVADEASGQVASEDQPVISSIEVLD